MKKNKSKVEDPDRITNRISYLRSRAIVLEEFSNFLKEIEKNKPDIEKVISGKIFQEYTLQAIFRNIKDQIHCIEYCSKHPESYIDIKEEKVILKKMIKDTKMIFKKDYDKLYDFYEVSTL